MSDCSKRFYSVLFSGVELYQGAIGGRLLYSVVFGSIQF